MLVRVMTGVFDPPPATLAVPWRYLMVVAVCAVVSLGAAVTSHLRLLRRSVVEVVRDL